MPAEIISLGLKTENANAGEKGREIKSVSAGKKGSNISVIQLIVIGITYDVPIRTARRLDASGPGPGPGSRRYLIHLEAINSGLKRHCLSPQRL